MEILLTIVIAVVVTLFIQRNKRKRNDVLRDLFPPSPSFQSEVRIEDQLGYYGTKRHSPSNKFRIIFRDGQGERKKWLSGQLALISDNNLLWEKQIQRPHDCQVTDDGIVMCCDWTNSESLTGVFRIFDATGEEIFSKKTTANLGMAAVSKDSSIAIFETHVSKTSDSEKIFIVNVAERTLLKKIERGISFKSAHIDSANRLLKLKGYDNQVLELNW